MVVGDDVENGEKSGGCIFYSNFYFSFFSLFFLPPSCAAVKVGGTKDGQPPGVRLDGAIGDYR